MYLKNLQLLGFKTFADKTDLHFPDGITCVVGPNGSGKSNISDALKWVLGEQSMKDLRSASLQEVIFNGSQGRKPLGMAQVVLTVDNSDNQLPTEFSEVSISRCVYRSGESEFAINKTPCRLKDIHDLFLGTGLGRDTYSIVGQGQVDLVLSSKPEERRLLFEEAAGVSRIKYRKKESLRKLDSASQNLSRVLDILTEVEGRLEPLHKQAEKAKRYVEVKDRFRELDLALKKVALSKLSEQQLLHDAKIQLQQNQILEVKEKLNALENDKEQLVENEKECERAFQSEQDRRGEASARRNSFNESLAVLQERKNSLGASRAHLENEIKRLEDALASARGEKEQAQIRKQELELQCSRFENSTLEQEKQLGAFSSQLDAERRALEERNKELIEILRQLALFKNEKVFCEKILREHDEEESALLEEKSRIEQKYGEIKTNLEILSGRLHAAAMEEQNLASYAAALDALLEEVLESHKKLQNEKHQADSLLLAKQSEISVYESFFKFHSGEELVDMVRSRVPEFGRKLFSSLRVREGYERALEAAVGEWLQRFIVQSTESAGSVLSVLKENKKGRAALAVLDRVPQTGVPPFPDDFARREGVCGHAQNFISFEDERLSPLLAAVLGTTLVVENTDAALSLIAQFPSSMEVCLVTLDGDVVSSRGFIEGGTFTKESFFEMEKFRKKAQDELRVLEKKCRGLEISVDFAEKVLTDVKQDVSRAASALRERKDEKNRLESEVVSLQEKEKSSLRERDMLNAQLNACGQEKEHYGTQYTTLKEKIHVFENQNSFLESHVREIENKIYALERQHEERRADLTQVRMERVKAQEQLLACDETLLSLDAQVEKSSEGLQMARLKVQELSLTEQGMIKEEEDYQQRMREAQVEIEKLETEISALQDKRRGIVSRISENDAGTKTLWESSARLNEALKELEIEQTRNIISVEDIGKTLQDEYELTQSALVEMECIAIEDEAQAQAQLSRWRNSLKYMGSVNLEAEKEYEELKERHTFLSSQKQDIESSVEKLKETIRELDTEARSIFLKTFYEIEKHFTGIFSELFGGGEAKLILLEGEDIFDVGVDLKVQLPGKALQPISLLSGGEKSLVAIALLFAILAVNPSPFCVLDEIDAALDESNVGRFADIVRKFSEKTQFIVITHNKGTMKAANVLYGVTMEEPGISKLISVKLGEVQDEMLVER